MYLVGHSFTELFSLVVCKDNKMLSIVSLIPPKHIANVRIVSENRIMDKDYVIDSSVRFKSLAQA